MLLSNTIRRVHRFLPQLSTFKAIKSTTYCKEFKVAAVWMRTGPGLCGLNAGGRALWRSAGAYAGYALTGDLAFARLKSPLPENRRLAARHANGCRWQHARTKNRPMGSISIVKLAQDLKRYSCPAPLVNPNAPATAHEFHAATGNRAQKPKLRAFQSPFHKHRLVHALLLASARLRHVK